MKKADTCSHQSTCSSGDCSSCSPPRETSSSPSSPSSCASSCASSSCGSSQSTAGGEGEDDDADGDSSSSKGKEPEEKKDDCCSSKSSVTSSCSSKEKASEEADSSSSSCSSKKESQGDDDCCAPKSSCSSKKDSQADDKKESQGGDDCCTSKSSSESSCSSKKEEVGSSSSPSCSSKKATEGGDDCCAPKSSSSGSSCSSKQAPQGDDCCAPPESSSGSSCSSKKAPQSGDDCCAPESSSDSSCSSKKAPPGGDDCCAPKSSSGSSCSSKQAPQGDDCCAPPKSSSGSSCSSKKAPQSGDDCCAPKNSSGSSCSSKKAPQGGDDCCAPKSSSGSSCSSKKAPQGGDDCCAPKSSSGSSCSSKGAPQGGDDCCAPNPPPVDCEDDCCPPPECDVDCCPPVECEDPDCDGEDGFGMSLPNSSCMPSKDPGGGDDCCAPKPPSSGSSCSSNPSQPVKKTRKRHFHFESSCSQKIGHAGCKRKKKPPCRKYTEGTVVISRCSSRPSPPRASARGTINSLPSERKTSDSWWPSWLPFVGAKDEEERGGEKQPLLSKGSKPVDYGSDDELVRLTLDIEGMTCDGCGAQIYNFLGGKIGVAEVSVSVLTKRGTFDYYPSRITEEEIIAFLIQLGFTPTVVPNSTEASFYLRVTSNRGAFVEEESISSCLDGAPGVNRLTFEKREGDGLLVYIVYDFHLTSTRTLIKNVNSMGDLAATLVPARTLQVGSSEQDQVKFWKNSLLITIALGLPVVVLSITESILGHSLWAATIPGLPCLRILDLIQFILATIVQFWIGQAIYERAWTSLYFGGRADMDVLIACSTTVAWAYSTAGLFLNCFLDGYEADLFFDTCCILMALIILGRYLEIMAKGEASKKLNSILSLQVPTAILVDESNDSEEELDIELICQQDLVKILPGMTVPLDGVVYRGESSVDESMVTGESLPIHKKVGDDLLGGTINQDGLLLARITKIHSEGTIAQMHTLMEEAQHQKPKAQRVADQVASYFVPIIIGLSLVIFVVWFLMCFYGVIEPLEGLGCVTFSLKFMITMLIISCPCAIALAAPTPLVVAAGVAAKLGAVLKSSDTFETFQKVDTLVVDKTGTLTYGQLEVRGVGVASGMSMDDFLWLTGSAECGSEHPIGKALASYARSHASKTLSIPDDFEAKRGAGLVCEIDGHEMRIGSSIWLDGDTPGTTLKALRKVVTSQGRTYQELENEGMSLIFVEIDAQPSGFFALSDRPKPHVECVIQGCQQRGVEVIMCSGDSRAAVQSLGATLGMDPRRCLSRHTPEMKCELIDTLQKEGKVVAFVGDGVNDSIALAQADVGIAVNEGTSIAMEAADVVLMRDDLWIIVQSIDLARVTYGLIKWNFCWAFLYNLVALPLSGGLLYPFTGFQLPPFYAGFAEMLSSLPVIGFSLLLKYYTPAGHDDCRRFFEVGFDITRD